MSRADTFLWVLLPYVALTSFVVGHVWRYRRDGYTWTARSTQLLERRLLLVGSVAFHLGMLGVIGGHVIGILVPEAWTDALGISERLLPLDGGRFSAARRACSSASARSSWSTGVSGSTGSARRRFAAIGSCTRCSSRRSCSGCSARSSAA